MPERSAFHDLTTQAGGQFGEEAGWQMPLHFGDPAAEYQAALQSAVLIDLSHRGTLELTGADAASFLHNLSTQDCKTLPLGQGREAFFANAQARIVGHGWIHHFNLEHWPAAGDEGAAFWLDLAPGTVGPLLQHLDHFLISEQVILADRTRELAKLHFCGPQSPEMLAAVVGPQVTTLPSLSSRSASLSSRTLFIIRHDVLGQPGFHLVVRAADAATIWQALCAQGARPAGMATYHTLRVQAGTPIAGQDFGESQLVPEVNRIAQAVSYTKGCYLGQEPIVRIRDLGHVNRVLMGIRITEPGEVPPGARLWRDGKEVGTTTSVAKQPNTTVTLALAYLRRGSLVPGTWIEVETEAGPLRAEVSALPFSASVPSSP